MFYTPNIVCYQGFLSWGSWVKFDMWFSLEIVMVWLCVCVWPDWKLQTNLKGELFLSFCDHNTALCPGPALEGTDHWPLTSTHTLIQQEPALIVSLFHSTERGPVYSHLALKCIMCDDPITSGWLQIRAEYFDRY